jgi:hypothetical protein
MTTFYITAFCIVGGIILLGAVVFFIEKDLDRTLSNLKEL